MSNPDDQSAAQDKSEATTSAKEPLTFAQQVNEVAKTLTQDEKGVWQKPEGSEDIDENVLFAATLEARRRNTESHLGKTKHELVTERGLREKFEQRIASQVKATLTVEQADELETLKQEDPDAWRVKMDEYESAAEASLREELKSDRTAVSQEAELERRKEVLKRHNEEHPDAPVTDEALQNDIPPRISKKLEDGKITFEEFLVEATNYLRKPKVVDSGDKPVETSNLSKVGGGDTPSQHAKTEDFHQSYKTTVF